MPGSSPGNWRGQLGPNGPLARGARQIRSALCIRRKLSVPTRPAAGTARPASSRPRYCKSAWRNSHSKLKAVRELTADGTWKIHLPDESNRVKVHSGVTVFRNQTPDHDLRETSREFSVSLQSFLFLPEDLSIPYLHLH